MVWTEKAEPPGTLVAAAAIVSARSDAAAKAIAELLRDKQLSAAQLFQHPRVATPEALELCRKLVVNKQHALLWTDGSETPSDDPHGRIRMARFIVATEKKRLHQVLHYIDTALMGQQYSARVDDGELY